MTYVILKHKGATENFSISTTEYILLGEKQCERKEACFSKCKAGIACNVQAQNLGSFWSPQAPVAQTTDNTSTTNYNLISLLLKIMKTTWYRGIPIILNEDLLILPLMSSRVSVPRESGKTYKTYSALEALKDICSIHF